MWTSLYALGNLPRFYVWQSSQWKKSKKKFGEPIVVQFLLEVRREKCYFPAYFDRKSSEVYKQK